MPRSRGVRCGHVPDWLSSAGFILVPTKTANQTLLLVIACCVVGYIMPTLYLTRKMRFRQERIVRSLPDVMDLLWLCVEAGLGFDAASYGSRKRWKTRNPDIAAELLLVNRKVNAGVTREEALRARTPNRCRGAAHLCST